MPVVNPVLSNAHQNNNNQSQDELWSVVEEGGEVLGHDRLLQGPLIVSSQVGDGEEKGDNRIEKKKSKWIDNQFPPDQSVKSFLILKIILVSDKVNCQGLPHLIINNHKSQESRLYFDSISPKDCFVSSSVED